MNKHYTYPTDDPNPSGTKTELSLEIYLLNSQHQLIQTSEFMSSDTFQKSSDIAHNNRVSDEMQYETQELKSPKKIRIRMSSHH